MYWYSLFKNAVAPTAMKDEISSMLFRILSTSPAETPPNGSWSPLPFGPVSLIERNQTNSFNAHIMPS
eukprot:CAMPEP_0204455684 /NCGR_PEP_ID=MMETSP0471-20130131/1451_1 /ASSEMBLY_ACC=CAM_ASM_000602 /TAXON_ID=2969 /ORGANISM="Oxyrrhis marina" /LENGTH=67 /DNA_ID=CAMNT_0051455799 /DNA_START=67 /DNA_END=267 /DNA_ORIENTATION=-